MKAALSIWNGRIAPVFDVSARCLIVDTANATVENASIPFPETPVDEPLDQAPDARAEFLASNGVELLVCGAISAEYENALIHRGIELVSFIAGPVQLVRAALLEGTLERKEFSMPGCGCPRRRCRNRGRHSLSFGLSNPDTKN